MSHSNNWTIRFATQEDGKTLADMVRSLLIHLGEGLDNFDEQRFLNDAFGAEPQFSVLVASNHKRELGGYALYHDAYEPSHAARGVYVSDLFVKEDARGEGVGKLLIAGVAQDGKSRGREFIWLVSPQEDARAFYDNTMNLKDEVVAYALAGESFDKFAGLKVL